MTTTKDNVRKINGVDVDALTNIIGAIKEQPVLGQATFHSTGKWIEDRHVRTSVSSYDAAGSAQQRGGSHEIDTDLPKGLLGQDRGPSPLELALSTLSACVITTLVGHAAASGFQIDTLEVQVEGDLDFQGIFGLDANVRPSYQQLRVHVHLGSKHSDEEKEESIRSNIIYSPMWDLFNRGTNLETITHLS